MFAAQGHAFLYCGAISVMPININAPTSLRILVLLASLCAGSQATVIDQPEVTSAATDAAKPVASLKRTRTLTVRTTRINGAYPSAAAKIVKYYFDKAAPQSGCETGSLHILYEDGKEVVSALTVQTTSKGETTSEHVFRPKGFDDVKLAPDKRSIGWTTRVENCCTSYSIPMVLSIYRSGKNIWHVQQGQMIWYWSFLDGGKQVVAVWGATHGPEIGRYQLFDSETGKVLAEVTGDAETQALAADAPDWAKKTESAMHQR